MTAMAIALVLCCAMVCGTLVYLRTAETKDADAWSANQKARDALVFVETVATRLREHRDETGAALTALRAEVDDLKKNAAYRSLR